MQRIVTDYSEESGEQKLVSKAVATAWEKEKLYNDTTTETDGNLPAKLKAVRSAREELLHTTMHTNSYSITLYVH